MADEQTPSDRVIEAVAAATGTDPTSVEQPLYDAVDPDALDALFRSEPYPTVEFEYAGHNVVVRRDGSVAVDGVVRAGPTSIR